MEGIIARSLVGSHVLKYFTLDRAVSVVLAIEVLRSVSHSVAGVAGNRHTDGAGGGAVDCGATECSLNRGSGYCGVSSVGGSLEN